MSSTHLSLHYHLVFGTKNHEPVITPAWRDRLYAYLGGAIRTLDGVPGAVGWHGGPRPFTHRLASDAHAGRCPSRNKISFFQMGPRIGRCWLLCVAGRIWRFYGKRFAIGKSSTLHSTTAGTSSNTHLSRGMFGIASTWCRGISLKFSPAPARGC